MAACGAERSAEPSSASSSSQGSASVPRVAGMTEADAVRALGAVGLVANVRYADGAPRTGLALGSDPAADTEIPTGGVVVVSIALGPRLPMPTPAQEQVPEALSRLVRDHTEAFVGLYRDKRGALVVTFGPGVDPAAWTRQLASAARGVDYDRCPRDRTTLRSIQDEIVQTRHDWNDVTGNAFGAWVQVETCTVRIESDLLSGHEITTLVGRYGTALSFDTTEGSAPSPLSLDLHN